MQIAKISSVQNVNKYENLYKTKQKNSNPVYQNYDNNAGMFNVYAGRDIISFGSKPFSQTLKENYYQLPEGCYPDAFQIEAGKALNEGKDVLVEAPTGTGKTAIAHYAATRNMEEGKTTFYTTPLKALSNQKLNEFRKVYGEENVGILTGDRRENVEAPIIIMTTEVYRNMALSNMYGEENPLMKNLGTVIFDEFHYLGDPDRGPVWEESVMYTPKNVQTLELSATIGNPTELRNWIGGLKEDDNVALVSIPSEARHVPLSFDMLSTKSYEKMEKKIEKAIRRGETPDFESELTVKKPKLSDFKAAVEKLNEKEQLPAIFFIFSRKYSRETLEYLSKEGLDLTNDKEKEEIQKIVDRYTSEKYVGADLDVEALKKGYAIHNAGIIPGQKELIEELFQKKLLKVVIATETLAAGINMPAKTVVISSPYKPCDESADEGKLLDEDGVKIEETEDSEEPEKTPVRLLTANEFKQMSGRAGRRGIDTIGYVYTMPTTRASEQDFLYLEAMDSNPINSNYNPDYAFLSGYYEHNYDDSKLGGIFDKSFFAYSKDEDVRNSKIDELLEISARKTQILLDRGFLVEEDGVIEPTLLANMASKVKGYDTLTLAEAMDSKVFDGISPQALAMIAGAIALPARSNETAIGFDTDLSYVFEKTQQSVGNVHQKLTSAVNSMLIKFGKTIDSFSSYEQMMEFVESLEKPQASEEEIKAALNTLEAKRAKMYKITKTTGNYSVDEVVRALKNGEVVPTKALESHFASVQTFKKKINTRTIEDYVEKLRAELEDIDTSAKGNKAKARVERKQKEVETSIKLALNMQFLDENIPDALASNHQFLKKNPPQQVRDAFNDTESMYLRLTMKDALLQKIEALQALEIDADSQEDENAIMEYDRRKINDTFRSLLKKSSEIYETEINNGINASVSRYNKDAAQIAYAWANLNQVNPYDSMTNWSQLIRLSSDDIDEGSIYRNIMQTADLLSQIGEMALVGEENARTEDDVEYYHALRQTAAQSRELILKEPATI